VFFFPARRLWGLPLNLVGVVLVGLDLAQRSLAGAPVPVAIGAWAGWVCWLIGIFVPEPWPRLRAALCLGMIAGASLAGVFTNTVGFVPAVAGLLIMSMTPAIPLRVAGGAAAGSALLIVIAATAFPAGTGSVIGVMALLLISSLAGLSRRQTRMAEAQSRALLEERIAVEQERTQVAALTERTRIARDLHDVLAHSLGGLVIQLEAVDALLESGRGAEAHERVQAARALAVSGLNDAKQAVSALREPDEPLSEVVAGLAETHRLIGGQVAVRGDADRGVLAAAGRTAAWRAVQELLTNARRHAPGAPTTLDLDWDDDTLTITASTPPAFPPPAGNRAGGGHGLAGMRERVSEAGGTMTVREGPPFEVVLRLPGRKAAA